MMEEPLFDFSFLNKYKIKQTHVEFLDFRFAAMQLVAYDIINNLSPKMESSKVLNYYFNKIYSGVQDFKKHFYNEDIDARAAAIKKVFSFIVLFEEHFNGINSQRSVSAIELLEHGTITAISETLIIAATVLIDENKEIADKYELQTYIDKLQIPEDFDYNEDYILKLAERKKVM